MTPSRSTNRPAGPRGLPLLGSARDANQSLLDLFTANARTYGDVVYFEIVKVPFYQLNHPDDIGAVLEDDQTFQKGRINQEVLKPVVGTGLFTSEGSAWHDQRRRVQPLFEPAQIAGYGDIVTECTERLFEAKAAEGHVDLQQAMSELALEIDARALLGVELTEEFDAIGRNIDVILEYIESTANLLLPAWAPTPGNRRFKRAIAELEAIVDWIIDERRGDPAGDDVVSRLITNTNERGESLSPRQLRDEVMTFLIVGPVATAVALTFTFYLVATHPAVEDRLREELATGLDGDPPSVATVREFAFAEQVITESMRLFPPINRIHREPAVDVDLSDHLIPAGGNLVLPQWVVHRDSRWYPDPLAFHPARWTDAFRAGLPDHAYIPFGTGPRQCVGERYAKLVVTLVLTMALQQYHLEISPGGALTVEAAVTTRPTRPVWMTVHKREARTVPD